MRAICVVLGLSLAEVALSDEPLIVVLGDSLSAGYGIDVERGWVARLQARLAERGYPHRVLNHSISGETSRGALQRLPAILTRNQPDLMVLELGGNDGLQGLSLEQMRANLAAIIEQSRQQGAAVLLVRIKLPPNYGPAYTRRFDEVYQELAKVYAVAVTPFILRGITPEHPELMHSDGIHPLEQAQNRMLDNVWPSIESLL